MTRRPGLSLTEVLVALFIMGIGTIAILTLFPLGALNMAQAFRDDRTTQSVTQADAYLRWYVQDKKDASQLSSETWVSALSDPNSVTSVSKFLVATPPGLPKPSYPVFIDPMGQLSRGAPTLSGPSSWIGDGGFGDGSSVANSSAISRHTLVSVNALPLAFRSPFAIRICTLLDGFGYDKSTGSPDTANAAATVDRDLRYNWLWVIQKKDNTTADATMTVVVFDKRAPNFAAPGGETVFTPTFAAPGQTLVSFAAGAAPVVQKGGWLMDATVVTADGGFIPGTPATMTMPAIPPTPETLPKTVFAPSLADGTGPTPPGFRPWIRNANFYRVVSVTDNSASGGGIDFELEAPLRDDVIPMAPPVPPATNPFIPLPPGLRRFIYLNGAAEVFERLAPLPL